MSFDPPAERPAPSGVLTNGHSSEPKIDDHNRAYEVVDDWPQIVPISHKEIEAIETYLATLVDAFLIENQSVKK